MLGASAFLASSPAQAPRSAFGALVDRLSEPDGYFGGDNLISNEQSYLRVLPALERSGVRGGVYLGVGPDQNFSYIAQVRPDLAFLIDVRRDNLRLHLLFKALFSLAPTRLEYLALLTGRAPPAGSTAPARLTATALVAAIDAAPRLDAAGRAAVAKRIDRALSATGVALGDEDRLTAHRFHQEFMAAGLDLVFQAFGQPRQYYYPTLRDLIVETDGAGGHRSYLASDEAYGIVRSLQARDAIVPVVGDVAGSKAMREIGREMAARRLTLGAFYISNVEQYLFRDGAFEPFIVNLRQLPRRPGAQVIRSVFPSGYRGRLPQSAPGHYSTSLAQPLDVMLADAAAGRYRRYSDLVAASAR